MAALFIAVSLLSVGAEKTAAAAETVEVKVEGRLYVGQTVAHNASVFWLLARDGRLHRLPVNGVTHFRKLPGRFRSFSAAEIRSALREEFGRGYDIAGTSHFLVAAPRGRATTYAALFENVYRQFRSYFSARGFRLERPAFPLVAVVFGSYREFAVYARKDGIFTGPGVLGYYHLQSNRVALYDSLGRKTGGLFPADVFGENVAHFRESLPSRPRFESFRLLAGGHLPAVLRVNGMNATLADTIVHEVTHQAAFNTGLHSRIGPTPRWVVEGLATVFEAPGIRNRSGNRGSASRINPGRLDHFRKYAARSRPPRFLARFVADDSAFRNALNAYSEAWALSFFLMERKSPEYSRYLRILRQRDPMKPDSAAQRLADFQQAFGTDLDRLEVQYLRFLRSLK